MLKMLAYDLKRNMRPIAVLSFIATAFFIIFFLTNDLYYELDGRLMPSLSLVGIHNGVFIVLSIIMPFFVLRFKMNKISIDQMYSLPIKRQRLYLEKYILGLIAIFIPYTLAMVASHIVVLFREHALEVFPSFYYVIPAYFSIGLILIIFYTISCFFYTRCNTALDGILVSIGSALFMSFLATAVAVGFIGKSRDIIYNQLCYLNLIYIANFIGASFNTLISNFNLEYISKEAYLFGYLTLYVVLAGLAMYGYIALNKRDKAEEATGISKSVFAYRLWIPLYAIASALLLPFNMFSLPIGVLMASSIYIAILIYLKSFKTPDRIYLYAYGAFILTLIIKLLIY